MLWACVAFLGTIFLICTLLNEQIAMRLLVIDDFNRTGNALPGEACLSFLGMIYLKVNGWAYP